MTAIDPQKLREDVARIARRDRLCDLLGKQPKESWDAFYQRMSAWKHVPYIAKCIEELVK